MPSLHGDADADLRPIAGAPPSLIDVPSGCAFHPRCRWTDQTGGRSHAVVPDLLPVGGGSAHRVACHLTGPQRARLRTEELHHLEVTR
jgi:peptide/nickel transport system ATP-binding protein